MAWESKYSFATFVASMVAASMKDRGIPPSKFKRVVDIVRTEIPALRGRGEPENGFIRVHPEDCPNFLIWAEGELREAETVDLNPLAHDTAIVIPMRGILLGCIAQLQEAQ